MGDIFYICIKISHLQETWYKGRESKGSCSQEPPLLLMTQIRSLGSKDAHNVISEGLLPKTHKITQQMSQYEENSKLSYCHQTPPPQALKILE